MSTHHLIRPEEKFTFCGIDSRHLNPAFVLETDEAHHPRRHDRILPALKKAGGMPNVCQTCIYKRILPWPADHGQTPEDEYADDDENWKRIEQAAREKSVD